MNKTTFPLAYAMAILMAIGLFHQDVDAQGLRAPMQAPPRLPASAAQGRPLPTETQMKVRIKDITSIEGHYPEVLTGFGLVTGLNKTGGKTDQTERLARNLFANQDINLLDATSKSLSVVAVTAEIPPFAKPGEAVIATLSVMDEAESLMGGVLLPTSLKGNDGVIYAQAYGPVNLGGFAAGGAGASVQKNIVTTGKVDARIVLTVEDAPAFGGNQVNLLLKNKDFATAYRIATEINKYFPRSARPLNEGAVEVVFPRSFQRKKIDFIVMINELRIVPDMRARVVINSRTGTIVAGHNVRISQIMIARDNLVVTTTESPIVSQPAPFSDGTTEVLPRTQISATQEGGRYNILNEATTVGDLANALNAIGISPSELVSIFDEIVRTGKLQAELIKN